MKIEDLNNLTEAETKEILVEFYNNTDDMIKPNNTSTINSIINKHIINCQSILKQIKEKS